MVGGKIDLEDKRSVTSEEAIELSNSYELIGHFECSSKRVKSTSFSARLLAKLSPATPPPTITISLFSKIEPPHVVYNAIQPFKNYS